MNSVPAVLRRQVIFRAGDRCEYCGLAQEGQEATFHVDHIVPRAAGGPTLADNLALACVSCSLRKESRRSGQDPETGRTSPLFNPRRQRWTNHFRWNGFTVVGLTPTGRTTIATLRLNRPLILAIRAEEAIRGRHPPHR
jgi:HNH endonuclease